MVGAVTGIAAHDKTVRGLSAIAEMFCSSVGRLCMILTDLAGKTSWPSLIIQIPLLAVQEKSPFIGLTAYVYQSLLIRMPFFVSLMMLSRLDSPSLMVRLCGAAVGIGKALRPSGEPNLHAFPDETVPSLNAL
jgi:hypothetical protein